MSRSAKSEIGPTRPPKGSHSQLQRSPSRHRDRRRRRKKSHLLRDRRAHRCPQHDSIDVERPARTWPIARRGSRVYPDKRPRFPAAAAVRAGARQGDRRAAESATRRSRWVLRRQQSDDDLQRTADVLRKRFSNHYSFDVNYTFSKGYGDAGRRPGGLYLSTSTTHRISGIPVRPGPSTIFATG